MSVATIPGAGLRIVCSILGLVLSVYAVYVEVKVHRIIEAANDNDAADEESMEEFSALCDIAAIGASCSQVFQLPQGRMLTYFGLVPKGSVLDVPNAVLGSIFYFYMLVASSSAPREVTYFMTAAAFASSVFLAYQLTFVVMELCLLCWSTHAINTTLAWNLLGPGGKQKDETKTKAM